MNQVTASNYDSTHFKSELNQVALGRDNDTIGPSLAVFHKVNPLRRTLAFVLDFFGFNWLTLTIFNILAALPLVSLTILPQTVLSKLLVILLLLARDFFFEGRGLGRNLMGLQVVDKDTGKPASLIQSVKRNALLLVPFLLWIIAFCFHNPSVPLWKNHIWLTINTLLALYFVVCFGIETYLLFVRIDGLRIADRWAKTTTIVADSDFSNPICLHKSYKKPVNAESRNTY